LILKNKLNRRNFLILIVLSFPLIILGGVWLRQFFKTKVTISSPLKNLSSYNVNVLIDIYEIILGENIIKDVGSNFEDSKTFYILELDRYLNHVYWIEKAQLKFIIFIFDLLPIVWGFYLKNFCSLSTKNKKDFLKRLENNNNIIKVIFLTFKEMSYLFFYSWSKSWDSISYDGPIVDGTQDYSGDEAEYLKLFYKKV
jgi:hypothetical protein